MLNNTTTELFIIKLLAYVNRWTLSLEICSQLIGIQFVQFYRILQNMFSIGKEF